MGTLVSLDGKLVPPEQAVVSVFDRGFLYGDSVYEVLRTYGGRPFAVDAHLARLEGSAARIGLELPRTRAELAAELDRTLSAAGNEESYVRLVVTRGSGELSLDPFLAQDPKVIVIVRPIQLPPKDAYERGVKVQLVGIRKTGKESLDPRAKTGNYLNSVLALREARRHGAFEAILLDQGGAITEGASSNVFVVKGGRLATPPVEAGILEGVTRATVFEVAASLGVPVEERRLVPDDLLGADEAMITSSIRELVPVVAVGVGDETRPVGHGMPGPVVTRITAAFRAHARRAVGLPA